MIIVDNQKVCSAVVHFACQDNLEQCPAMVQSVFDGSRLSEFHTFLDNVMHVWVGLGKEDDLSLLQVKSAAALASRTMRKLKQTEYQVDASAVISLFGIDSVYDLTSGLMLGLYQYEGCYSKPKEKYQYTAFLQGFEDNHQEEIQEIVNKSANVAQGVMMARDWVNMPGNLLNPVTLAEKVVAEGKAAGCEAKVVDIKQAKKLGMNLFLSVGLSSDYPCSIVVLRYMGNPDDKEVTALVGKGVTLDTGGYSLKSREGLINTKGDMGGAAAVTAAVCALAKNKAKTNVLAVVPIVENRLSNTSSIPGDVYVAMNGKTVEILSSDAEGRLILADAITYAIREEKADRIVDVATLTGAIAQSYGKIRAGVMTNNDEFEDELLRAGARAGEKYVDLPTDDEYREMVNGRVADLANSTRSGCGSIVAGLFLREFAEDHPWLHLDIAGVSRVDKPVYEFQAEGATGASAATMYFLMDHHFTAADRF